MNMLLHDQLRMRFFVQPLTLKPLSLAILQMQGQQSLSMATKYLMQLRSAVWSLPWALAALSHVSNAGLVVRYHC
jgi:hypothetical protein